MEHTILLGEVAALDGGEDYGVWIHKGKDGWNIFVGRNEKTWYVDGPHDSVATAWTRATELFAEVKETYNVVR